MFLQGEAKFNKALRLVSTYLAVPQSEGHVVEPVDVSGFDGGGDDSGVDSDFPRPRVPRVVGDPRVGARLQDVADAVVAHEHHGHAP